MIDWAARYCTRSRYAIDDCIQLKSSLNIRFLINICQSMSEPSESESLQQLIWLFYCFWFCCSSILWAVSFLENSEAKYLWPEYSGYINIMSYDFRYSALVSTFKFYDLCDSVKFSSFCGKVKIVSMSRGGVNETPSKCWGQVSVLEGG